MALEKTKKDVLPLIDEVERIKSKHKKSPTSCPDQRRQYGHCGICGYGDIAFQGVDHCLKCGKEEEVLFLENDHDYWINRHTRELKCHYRLYRFKIRGIERKGKVSEVKRYGVSKCLACGAIQRSSCPNCEQPIWIKGNKRYCKTCGYTIN